MLKLIPIHRLLHRIWTGDYALGHAAGVCKRQQRCRRAQRSGLPLLGGPGKYISGGYR